MKIHNVLVSQANSKLGLKFVQQLVSLPHPPDNVFATYKTEEDIEDLLRIQETSKMSRIVLIEIDVTQPDNIAEAKATIEEAVDKRGLDLLINIYTLINTQSDIISLDNIECHFKANTIPSLTIFQIMLPLLEEAALRNSKLRSVFLNIIEDNSMVYEPAYEISKVALNLAMNVMADKTRKRQVLMFSTCLSIDDADEESQLEDSVTSMLLHVYQHYGSHSTTENTNIVQL